MIGNSDWNRNRIFIGMSRIYRTLATISGRPLLSQSGYADSRRMLPRQLPLTSLTRSAWPCRPTSPPLVHLPARASPPAHSNTLSLHTWLVVAAFLRHRQPSSPRITARRSCATHSPSPSRPPTNSYPPGPVSPRRAAYAVPPRRGAVWEGPGQSPVGGAGLPTCPIRVTRMTPRHHALTLLPS